VGDPRTRSSAVARSSHSYSPARQASSRAGRRGRRSGTSRLAGVRARSPSRIRRCVGSAPTLPSQTTRGPVLRQVLSAPAPAEPARRTIARDRSQASAGARSSRAPDGCRSASRAARGDPDVEFHPASLCPGTGAQPEGMSDRAEVDALPPTARSCASLATSTMSSVQRSTTSTRGFSSTPTSAIQTVLEPPPGTRSTRAVSKHGSRVLWRVGVVHRDRLRSDRLQSR
jgi:hypothetical protein